MRLLFSLLLLCSMLSACEKRTLPQEKLAAVLQEIQIKNATLLSQKEKNNWDSATYARKQRAALYDICQKYEVDRAQIKASYERFRRNSSEFEELMTAVKALYTKKEEPKKKAPSAPADLIHK